MSLTKLRPRPPRQQQHHWFKIVQQLARSSPVSAIARSPERSRLCPHLFTALVQVTPNFLFSCCSTHHARAPRLAPSTRALFCPVASTPRRVLRHLCTCFARPLCIDSAKSCRVSCFARQLRVSCRAVAVSSITSISFTLCAVRHALVHLECYLALLSHQPPKASTTALSLVLSTLEHRLEQCRTATLSATSLSSPPRLCTKLRAPMTLFATLPHANHTAPCVAP